MKQAIDDQGRVLCVDRILIAKLYRHVKVNKATELTLECKRSNTFFQISV